MKIKLKTKTKNFGVRKGFVALTTILIIVALVLNFSFVTLSSVYIFADSIFRRELRIQTRFNLFACIDYMKFTYAQNYFVDGNIKIRELGCSVSITNDFTGTIDFSATSTLSGVSVNQKMSLINDGFNVKEKAN